VAVAPGGAIAAGIDGAYEPDIYVFKQGVDQQIRSYDFGVVGNPGYSAELLASGLAWAPDSSRLFAITVDVYGEYPTLRVLNDATKAVSKVTVSAPATATRAKKLTVTGTLTATVAFPAGAKVTVTRKDLTDPKGKSLGSKSVASNGKFSFTDTPVTGGDVTYTATYAGDATHTAASGKDTVKVSRATSTVTVKTSASTYSYGKTVTVTAHLGKTYKNRKLSIYAKPAGGTKKLLKTGTVNSSGNLAVKYKLTRNTTFSAAFTGDARYAPKTASRSVGTKVSVSTTVSKYYKTGKIGSTKYYYFHKNNTSVYTTTMSYYAGREQLLQLQVYYQGRWYDAGSDYFALNSHGKSTVGLEGPGESGVRARVRASYIKGGNDGDSVNTTTHGSWKYIYFTN
jgi:hypothetical protein